MPQFRVTVDGLNLRQGPSTNDAIKTELAANSVVEKLEESADKKWFRVSAEKGGATVEGWVAARFLVPTGGTVVTPPHLSGNGWIDRIGNFTVERKEIPRPGNAPYFNSSHTMIGVLHTTESNDVNGAFNTLLAKHSAPHFIAGEGRILQCRPINKQAAALKSSSTYNPNSDAAVQIEMVGKSKQTLWTPDAGSRETVVAIMRWAATDPLDIPLQRPVPEWLDDCSDVPLPWAVSTNARRRAKDVWPKMKGWYMHMEVPVNDHWDCGALRFHDMLASAAT
jgi:hypothetical protein